jgi:hypothetical protein
VALGDSATASGAGRNAPSTAPGGAAAAVIASAFHRMSLSDQWRAGEGGSAGILPSGVAIVLDRASASSAAPTGERPPNSMGNQTALLAAGPKCFCGGGDERDDDVDQRGLL